MKRIVISWVFLFVATLACQPNEPGFSLVPTGQDQNINQLEVQVATPLVNVDTAARLLINYRAYDYKAQIWFDFLDFLNGSPLSVTLFVDGVQQANKMFFQPDRPGVYTLQAKAGELVSPPISVTARAAQSYELVRLPVILHYTSSANTALMPITTLLRNVNRLYANQVSTSDPNQANAYIEFYPADRDPDGNLLAQPGMNRLPFSDQPTDSASAIKADSILRKWCIKKYINVFVKLNWLRNTYPVGYSYVSTPGVYTNRPANGAFTCETYRSQYSGPAIMIDWENDPGILAHELGHYLGLPHTFALGCSSTTNSSNLTIQDTPRHVEERPVNGKKRDCRGTPFIASNIMDYYVQKTNFTMDQVGLMRNTINNPVFLPLPSKLAGGRLQAVLSMPEVVCRRIVQ
ncbi:hypothetical protein JYG30_20315 [Fibrella sp. USSR17]